VDPDVALMVTYLAGDLPPEEAEQVENRFIEDEAFARKVQPLITIWTAPIDLRAAYEAAAAKERAPMMYPAIENPRRRVRETAPEYVVSGRPARSRAQRLLGGVFTGARAASWLAALLLVLAGVPVVVYEIGFANGREAEVLRLYPAPAPIAVPGGGDGKAPVETGDRTVRFGLSSLVRLHAGSRFLLARGLPNLAPDIGLAGEATIEVGLLERKVIVSTPAGIVELSHGVYALRAKGDPGAETLVTVGQGTATLKGGAGAADLVLSAGEHGHLAYPAPPLHTSGGDGYPALDRTGSSKP
jgi:anti-sigma factor RsiW